MLSDAADLTAIPKLCLPIRSIDKMSFGTLTTLACMIFVFFSYRNVKRSVSHINTSKSLAQITSCKQKWRRQLTGVQQRRIWSAVTEQLQNSPSCLHINTVNSFRSSPWMDFYKMCIFSQLKCNFRAYKRPERREKPQFLKNTHLSVD